MKNRLNKLIGGIHPKAEAHGHSAAVPVDTTNGSYDEDNKRIDGYIELKQKEPPVYCTCKDCGDRHIVKAAVYDIPKEKGKIL